MWFPGEDLIKTMWVSLTDKGVGSLLTPWQLRRTSRAQIESKREEILQVAQAEKDALDIRAGKKKLAQVGGELLLVDHQAEVIGDRIEPTLSGAEMVNAAVAASATRAVLDEVNVAKAILHAEDILKTDESPAPSAQIDADWLRDWRDAAARVSSDEMQSLWGRILAEEVKSPGNCSLRALNFVRCLSKEEAQKIEKVAPYVFDQTMILKYGSLAQTNHPLHAVEFMEMQEMGLVSSVDSMGFTGQYPSVSKEQYLRAFFCNGWALVVRDADPTKNLQVDYYRVTPLGKQIFTLSNSRPNVEYMRELGRHWASLGFTVSVAEAVPMEGHAGAFRFVNEQTV
ncbi:MULTISPECIES: DUF2806 domain-containing protein [Paraburkholderia]|uniref:DUF2806 domain-containing protein n=1 Tax=Paraburkholderia madseniana TaxID=2599607 RepID=A0AAP5ETA6_9BURK|nr:MULTISPECIES: DUF2806 domain-containing protein [Paraburkholderia]MCX4152362.1 DUF2806 domain-containing protein [Paraburkholderia madseniana]MDN7155290.1 DUF2806 domain-containing protein [Paraburkholderia sp. WS6]MDQ6414173.1 DUF2806 domain-containing protein [Paraburkholderia madseniana]